VFKKLTGLAAALFALTAGQAAWAACTYTVTDISDRDSYSDTWSGTQIVTDCFTENTGSFDWNTNDYTSSESSLEFQDGDSYGTKYESDASGVYTYHFEQPGYLNQDFVQTWNSGSGSLDVHAEQGVYGDPGWSRADTTASSASGDYTTTGSYDFYGGLLTRSYSQTGSNFTDASSVESVSYDGAATLERSDSISRAHFSGGESGTGQDFGNVYSYDSAYAQKVVTASMVETVRAGFLGEVLSRTEEFFSRGFQSFSNRTGYADGSAFESAWSNDTVSGGRAVLSGGDSLSVSGSRTAFTSSNRQRGAGYDLSSHSESLTVSSNWSRTAGGQTAWGSDYYANNRSGSDNTYGTNRTVRDSGGVYAARSGSAGSSSYSSWYSKAWNFVNGVLVSVSENGATSGDASLAAFYANFDPAVCEQFKDVANAQNVDYAYWGFCLDTLAPGYDAPAEEPEPEACFGKALGHEKGKGKGHEKGKGEGHEKNRCEDPSDSGNGKSKA
jgi:hypothetical protein